MFFMFTELSKMKAPSGDWTRRWTFLNCVGLCCTLTISRIIPFIVCRKKARQVFNSYLHVLQLFRKKRKGGCSPRFFCAQQKGPLRASLHPLYSLNTQSKRRFSVEVVSFIGITYIFKRRDIWQDPRHVNARNLDRTYVVFEQNLGLI